MDSFNKHSKANSSSRTYDLDKLMDAMLRELGVHFPETEEEAEALRHYMENPNENEPPKWKNPREQRKEEARQKMELYAEEQDEGSAMKMFMDIMDKLDLARGFLIYLYSQKHLPEKLRDEIAAVIAETYITDDDDLT